MAFRCASPSSNSHGTFTGHLAMQSPQPVHFVTSMYLAFSLIVTLNLGKSPDTPSTSEYVWSLMFAWSAHMIIFGDRMHMEQSFVGNVLSSCAMWPPMEGLFSPKWTSQQRSARSRDACIPAIPPPMTTARFMSAPTSSNRELRLPHSPLHKC